MKPIRSILFSLGIIASVAAIAQKPVILALSKTDHTLSVMDPVSLKVLGKVPVGPDPHEIIASDDGRWAFVANTGGGQFHEVNVIDLVSMNAMPNVDTGPMIGPHGIVFAGGKAWFSAEGAKAIGRIDPATMKVDLVVGTGQDRTHMIWLSPDAKMICTTNVNSSSVSILIDSLRPAPLSAPPGARPIKDWIQTVIPVGKGSEGLDVSPDGRFLWTAGAGDGMVSVIDLQSKKLIHQFDGKVLGANRVKFTTDGKRVLISCLRVGELFVFDATSRKEIKRIPIGRASSGILIEPGGARAFVACSPDNNVAVIDLAKLEVVARIAVGGNPDGLAWTSIPKQ